MIRIDLHLACQIRCANEGYHWLRTTITNNIARKVRPNLGSVLSVCRMIHSRPSYVLACDGSIRQAHVFGDKKTVSFALGKSV